MKPQVAEGDRERRKQVRLRVRGDISIAPHKYEGKTFYVVKDPVSLRYYRFKEQEHFLIRLMDGTHTLDDAQKQFEKQFRPDRLTLEDLEQFSQQLIKAGLVQNESPTAGKNLYQQKTKRQRTQLMQTFTNILYIKIPIFDPEKLLTKMLPYFRFMFTLTFLFLSVAFMLSAVFLVTIHFEVFRERMPSFHEFFDFKRVMYLWAALGVVKVIHEFGHGLSCKAFGGEVHEMGFLFLCLSPAMYCNVSDAWTMPNKWKRITVSFAGIYVELMIAAASTWVWWNTPGQPFINYMALSLMFVCSVSTFVFNGNPLMRFDGYYVLADLLEIPNMREKANRYLGRVFREYGLGIEPQPEPYMATGRKVLFITYAIASWCYRWMITFSILFMLATFLKPYKLEVLSQLLAVFAFGSMFGWPAWRMIQNLNKRGRLPDMKPFNVTITSIVFGAIILGFFTLPLPISRIRQQGIVELDSKAKTAVYAYVPGTLETVYVEEGEFVKKGALLATFRNQELEYELKALTLDANSQKELQHALQTMASGANPHKQSSFQQEANRARMQAQMSLWQRRSKESTYAKKLKIYAPRDGIVMGLPKKEDVGKVWSQEELRKPFCTIGDPSKMHVLVPIAPDDYELLKKNLENANKRGEALDVTIRVQGLGTDYFDGRVSLADLPKEANKTVPFALTTKGGGPLAVKPTSEPPDKMIPQTQVYLTEIHFVDTRESLMPGNLAAVKIHCEYRTAFWWVRRTLYKTFDLGLI